eukprot:8941226-Pyramimonas_sp.AAC.1
MRTELQQRDLAIAEMRGQLRGQADRERGPRGEMMGPKILCELPVQNPREPVSPRGEAQHAAVIFLGPGHA